MLPCVRTGSVETRDAELDGGRPYSLSVLTSKLVRLILLGRLDT